MKKYIYADNAATTQLDGCALESMIPWLKEEYGNASQPYTFSRKPKEALAIARLSIAECINAKPEEVFFTSGGTESDNWVIKGSAFSDTERRVTITSQIEHHAVLRSCESIERLGYPVKYLKPDKTGLISPDVLEAAISDHTRLVSIMFSNNEVGTIEPIQELAEIAHKYGAIFHTDAVQAVGHTSLNVQSLGVDMLSASAHKFNGPKGIGFLYVREGTILNPLNNGGVQEHGMRAGTENIASIVGMATALKKNTERISVNEQHVSKLEKILISQLNEAGIRFKRNGHSKHMPGIISLSFYDADGESLMHRLDLMGILVSTGSACNSVSSQVSHVLKAIGLEDSYARGTIRISLGSNNTEDEVAMITEAISRIIRV